MRFQPHAGGETRNAPETHQFAGPAKHIRPFNKSLVMAISFGMLFLALSTCGLTAQAPASATPQAQTPKHRRASHSKKHPKPAGAATPVQPPPAPPLPPVQQTAAPAKIDFSHGTLSIDAKNSSLTEILGQISHRTGIEIQGLDQDERIYGQYGPDTVANTLTDLLDGSGYNYVMIGGGDGSPPTKLVLTHSTGGATNGGSTSGVAAPGSFASPNGNAGDPSAQPTMPSAQPPNNPTSGQPKTPQEIFDQLRRMHPQ